MASYSLHPVLMTAWDLILFFILKMDVSQEKWMCIVGILITIFLRLCTELHPHSGQGKPPMYGDYEAQRHWMEITYNLPIDEWYHNTTDNNLLYWGLDYPPLTAYHMYICGIAANALNKSYVELHKSKGIESEDHKLFMRYTVLLSDILIFIPAIFAYFYASKLVYEEEEQEIKSTKKKKNTKKIIQKISLEMAVILALLYPGIILIDHGHFQYNCVSLGFLIVAVACIHKGKDLTSAFFFVLALNYKQMELYHALPFFMYLLSSCIPKPGQSALHGIAKLFKLGVIVAATFFIIWLPFLSNFKDFLQVIHRLFPIARGVFEDKVANFWCALNVFYKLKSNFCDYNMLRYCTMATLTATLPSLIDLFLRPNVKKFVPALINSSLAFFLFSYQVHEKSILLAAIPATLYLPNDPIPCFWFLFMSTFSMLPLLIKDGLTVAFVALVGFYSTSFYLIYDHTFKTTKRETVLSVYKKEFVNILIDIHKGKKTHWDIYKFTVDHFMRNKDFVRRTILYSVMFISLLGCFILFSITLIFNPPQSYPDLFPLLISFYSCLHFIGFFVYFNIVQILLPQSFSVPNVKVKTS